MDTKKFFDNETIKAVALIIIGIIILWIGNKYWGWFKSPKKCSSGPDCGQGYVCISGRCVEDNPGFGQT